MCLRTEAAARWRGRRAQGSSARASGILAASTPGRRIQSVGREARDSNRARQHAGGTCGWKSAPIADAAFASPRPNQRRPRCWWCPTNTVPERSGHAVTLLPTGSRTPRAAASRMAACMSNSRLVSGFTMRGTNSLKDGANGGLYGMRIGAFNAMTHSPRAGLAGAVRPADTAGIEVAGLAAACEALLDRRSDEPPGVRNPGRSPCETR